MKKVYLLLIISGLSLSLQAQGTDSRFLFPDFIDGKVIYKDGSIASGKMNYNLLLYDIQFQDGEYVLSLLNQNTVERFLIGGITMVSSKNGFAELIESSGDFMLIKELVAKEKVVKKGAYGTTSETSSTSNFYKNNLSLNPYAKFELEFSITFFVKKKKSIQAATLKGFMKIFPKHKIEIEKYLSSNKIEFSNEEDLVKLFNYCVDLSE